MEIVRLENYTFCYPNEDVAAIQNINLTVNQGEFVTICGKSGSGKSTLLKTLKPELSPYGKKSGRLLFGGEEIKDFSKIDSTKIGFVMQSPDNQIVTDTVWHELSFGLENMGIGQEEMRIRVAEIAAFFGIEKWFHKGTSELSGGQKQILNLASVMVMEPELLILDEPTSRLDPISAGNFFATLKKINTELGTTIILSEHRTEDIFPLTKRVIIMDEGKIILDDEPCRIGKMLKKMESDMFLAMPAAVRIYEEVDGRGNAPVSVGEARAWFTDFEKHDAMATAVFSKRRKPVSEAVAVCLENVYFKYEKNQPYVLSGLSLEVKKGEIYGILGGNGSGKTTLLSLISGILKLQSGKRKILGDKVGMLMQNPETLLIKNTVLAELLDISEESEAKKMMSFLGLEHLRDRHPYDLSGGEQQKLALGKILLMQPEVVLLDEPTKGFDAGFKAEFRKLLYELRDSGVTVIMVSHDVEFCAEVCDRCSLVFDGKIISTGTPREFFSGKKFYTTQTARIFKGIADNIVLTDEAIEIIRFSEELR